MRGSGKLKDGQHAALITMAVSAALALLKAVFGILSGALVLLTDALDSATDIVTSLAAYLGLKIAGRKPDERFNYGYYKAESLASLLISLLIIYAAVVFLVKGYGRIFILPEISYVKTTVAVAALSGVVAFIMHKYLKKKGELTNSQSLITSSKDRLKDVLASAAVLIGIIFTYLRIDYVEGIATMVISLLILRMGIGTIKDSVLTLMDVSPSRETEKEVVKILKQSNGLLSFEKLRLRKAGPFIFGEANIKVRKTANVQRAHHVSDEIEALIKHKIPEIESFTIHIEPYRSSCFKLLVPVSDKKGLDSGVDGHFGRARYYLFARVKDGRIESYYIRDNPFIRKDVRAGLSASKEVLKENMDAVLLQKIGEVSFHMLRDSLIEIYISKGDTARAAIENYISGRLKMLKEPTHPSDKEVDKK